MEQEILESAKSVQIFKSDRLGMKFYDDGKASLYALAYEMVVVGHDGRVHVGGIETGSIYTKGDVEADCTVLCEVIQGDVDEMLVACLTEEEEKEDINVYGFYEDLLDYSKKCKGTVFTEHALEYIRAKKFEYAEKIRLSKQNNQ